MKRLNFYETRDFLKQLALDFVKEKKQIVDTSIDGFKHIHAQGELKIKDFVEKLGLPVFGKETLDTWLDAYNKGQSELFTVVDKSFAFALGVLGSEPAKDNKSTIEIVVTEKTEESKASASLATKVTTEKSKETLKENSKPVIAKPATPVAKKAAKPATKKPATPVAKKPATPVAKKPATPTAKKTRARRKPTGKKSTTSK
ncbi:MAG: hypothetical protein ACI86H_000356 [bacterium]|jgi:hypothetical protein